MKVKDARIQLEGLSGDGLYQRARKLFEEETEARIRQRDHGHIQPTQGLIQSVVDEMTPWFLSVAKDLPWTEPDIPEKIIEWGTGELWVRYKLLDPRIEAWQGRVQGAKMRGSWNPLLETLTYESLEAASSMMLAQMKRDIGAVLGRIGEEETAEDKED